jgi:hypothetical protein
MRRYIIEIMLMTKQGLKYLFRHELDVETEVRCIAAIAEGPWVRIAVGQASGLIWRFDCTEERSERCWVKRIADVIPQGIAFGGDNYSLMVFGLDDGRM